MINSLQTAQHVINLIVRQSKDKIQQNKIVKTMSIPYSNAIVQNKRNDVMLHAGISYDKQTAKFFKRQVDSEEKPVNSIKDTYSFFSVKKCQQNDKQHSQISVSKQQPNKKALINYFKSATHKSRPSQISNKKSSVQKNLDLSKQEVQQSPFVKLEPKQQIMPKFMARQDNKIENLRDIKNLQFCQQQTVRKRQESESEISTQRQNKLTSYLQNHLSRQNNQHTYDIQGNLLLFSSENNRKAIGKAYPPIIRYEVQNEEDQQTKRFKGRSKGYKHRIQSNLELKRKQKFDPNIEGAKGEIFKSSVLKTINLSRISLGNQHFDQAQFMKRNDLFNNNHSRQTTSIPFVKVQGGSVFKQKATNQFISNKDAQTQAQTKKGSQKPMTVDRARSHQSKFRNEFKKFSLAKQIHSCSNSFIQNYPVNKMFAATAKNSKNNSYIDSRYSSFYIPRPHTTEVGRIKRENQLLFHSMLEE